MVRGCLRVLHAALADPPVAVLTHAIQAAQGIVMAARDGLRYTAAFWPQTQCTILSFAIISLIKVGREGSHSSLIH